jgi:hypothetical protein
MDMKAQGNARTFFHLSVDMKIKTPHCYEVILGYRVCFFNYLCKCFSVEPKNGVLS